MRQAQFMMTETESRDFVSESLLQIQFRGNPNAFLIRERVIGDPLVPEGFNYWIAWRIQAGPFTHHRTLSHSQFM